MKPNAEQHVKTIKKKFGARAWILRHLRKLNIDEDHLVRVYTPLIRPVLEFACIAYHALLTVEQSWVIEPMQMISLKSIYGAEVSYESCL